MKQVRCPYCQKLLFKGEVAVVEIKCNSCKRIINIKFFTKTNLLLTSEIKEAIIV